jgi:tetratricopeptide (TPR) repeat protein
MRFLCLLLLAVAPSVCAGDLLSSEKLEIINAGMEYLMDGRWSKAISAFDNYKHRDSTDPGRYLFKALTLLSVMTDRETDYYSKDFKKYIDSTEVFCERRLFDCDRADSAVCFLYRGHIRAYKSLYQARFGSSMAALNEGLNARGEYRRGLEMDSTLYDLYLGLGSYHYWKSVKAGFLKTVGIFANERDEGIEEIRLALDSSLFSKDPAKSALIWIMLNEKRYDSALVLARDLYNHYPNSNSFVWPMAQAYFENGQYVKAAMYYNKIFESQKSDPGNYYNLIESAWWLFKSYAEMNDNGQAYRVRQYVDSVYNDLPDKTKRKQRKKLYDMKHHRW